MQVCFQNLPSDRAPAQQPRGTRSSLAVKVCQKPRAMFPWQQWAWPGHTQSWANNSITHIYPHVIPDLSVPGRAAGPSIAHGCDALQVPVCLLHFGLYFYRTQQTPGRQTWMHKARKKGKTTSIPPIYTATQRMPAEQHPTSASA